MRLILSWLFKLLDWLMIDEPPSENQTSSSARRLEQDEPWIDDNDRNPIWDGD